MFQAYFKYEVYLELAKRKKRTTVDQLLSITCPSAVDEQRFRAIHNQHDLIQYLIQLFSSGSDQTVR